MRALSEIPSSCSSPFWAISEAGQARRLQRRVNQLLNAYIASPSRPAMDRYRRALHALHVLRGDLNN